MPINRLNNVAHIVHVFENFVCNWVGFVIDFFQFQALSLEVQFSSIILDFPPKRVNGGNEDIQDNPNQEGLSQMLAQRRDAKNAGQSTFWQLNDGSEDSTEKLANFMHSVIVGYALNLICKKDSSVNDH